MTGLQDVPSATDRLASPIEDLLRLKFGLRVMNNHVRFQTACERVVFTASVELLISKELSCIRYEELSGSKKLSKMLSEVCPYKQLSASEEPSTSKSPPIERSLARNL